MAARKNNRGRRRRGRFGFLYLLLSFFLILAALVIGSVVFFRADHITVKGNQRYTAEQIVAATQVEIGDNLFRISASRTARRLMDELPYIRSASVAPDFPNALIITVTESQAAASVQTDEGWFLLDARGKLVEQGGEPLRYKAAQVTGITPLAPAVGSHLAVGEKEQTRLNGLIGLLTALEGRGMLSGLTSVDLSAGNAASFGFAGRFTVKLPLNCDFDYKMKALEYVVGQLEENETGFIDLTRDDRNSFIPY